MHVVLFGGTGFIGRQLTDDLLACGYRVTIVARNMAKARSGNTDAQYVEWDYQTPLEELCTIHHADAIVNLAGQSIGSHRWTKAVKRKILESRVATTRLIVQGINQSILEPKVLINASAVGYYGPRRDELITEKEPPGNDFLASVCRAWEEEAYKVGKEQTRVVTLRIGLVLGSEGALKRMVLPFKLFIGGPLGNGNQWMPWVHIRDLTAMFRFVLEQEAITGPVNGTSPNPVTMKEFARTLGDVLHRPSQLRVPEWGLRLALGQMSELLLHGQRAVPEKLLQAGFAFRYPDLQSALESILA